MTTYTFIKSAVASEIMQLPKISFDCRQDNERELLDHIEANGYCQPSEIGNTAEAYDLVWSDLARSTDYEMPDFSLCKSSLECVEAEGQAVLNGAYYEATQEIAKDIVAALYGHDERLTAAAWAETIEVALGNAFSRQKFRKLRYPSKRGKSADQLPPTGEFWVQLF